jgi:hypothetical protein
MDQLLAEISALVLDRATIESWVIKLVGEMRTVAARITEVAAESFRLDSDVASKIETRGFVDLVVSRRKGSCLKHEALRSGPVRQLDFLSFGLCVKVRPVFE